MKILDSPVNISKVVLRIRVLRLHGSEHRLDNDVSIICEGRAVRLSSQRSEWALFYLPSRESWIHFQTTSGNAMCLCKDINGTKRIDFGAHLRMLIEGYSNPYVEDRELVKVHVPTTTQIASACQLSFPATNCDKRIPGYVFNEPVISYPESITEHIVVDPGSSSRSPGPVDIALGWMSYSFKTKPTVDNPTRRAVYEPPSPYVRQVWEPGMTSMSGKESGNELESVKRAVEFSQNLHKYYLL